MNGMHDIGGMDGFGRVPYRDREPVFHEPWEGRVFGMMMTRAGEVTPPTLDASRHRIERLEPREYLALSYYERWMAAIAADPAAAAVRHEDAVFAGKIPRIVAEGSPAARPTRGRPRFAVGERVITRNLHPHGHTRLPRYARGKRGVITGYHGAHVFPDTNAHGRGEHPQHLYTVRFAARELWGVAAEAKTYVALDLWQSYLEPDATPRRRRAAASGKAQRKRVR